MKRLYLLLITCSLLFLTACGGVSENANNEENNEIENNEIESNEEEADTSEENATENEVPENSEATYPLTIEHEVGETTLEEKPEKIVVLEWVYGENLLALGLEPIGMADIEGYNAWVNVEPELSEEVVDIGTRQEPSLEEIARLDPDLIITASFRHEGIQDQLENIAPTLMFNPYPEEGEDQYEEMVSTFETMATALGEEEKAEEVLANLNSAYDEVAAGLEQNGNDGLDFVLTQAFSANETAALRLFTDNAMAVQIVENIGLSNAFDASDFELYGYTETSVESLQPYQDAHFIYIVQDDDNVFENQLAGNPVWEGLSFVEEERTYGLPGDTWVFGGPLAAEVFAKEILHLFSEE
ncbi:ABC transporter substrate-binding protein [Salipaludibacillus sp. HK11]|uniref:ABC transporter substrate-binding protein n=1 Tax=Salipaludibacillus sp. HK11 TaxID=3394320 RepID=UPI0039FC3A80